MAKSPPIDKSKLAEFDLTYDSSHEDAALHARGEFLRKFPREHLKHLKIDDYVIGLRKPTFCDFVEVKTRTWAYIQGATAFKFGIYFGKTKSDPTRIYRFTGKFGNSKRKAFNAVKAALLDLVREGAKKEPNFSAIDDNPLSQLFKAKILSLYFPNKFLNVCSTKHLKLLGTKIRLPQGRPTSEYQHRLLRAKLDHPVTRLWSNLKFMAFLYEKYIWAQRPTRIRIQSPRKKVHRKVNFEDIQNQWEKIGKAAERFALEWEKRRLKGADLEYLIRKIKDRRDRPAYGYDFKSYTSAARPRFIEVKSVGKLPKNSGYRFFLSENEYVTSKSPKHRQEYYFYLVFFDGKGNPFDLHTILASDLYREGKKEAVSYMMRFDITSLSKEY